MSNVQAVTDATFQDEVLGQKGLVLVDFWAPWCGPCRMLAPTIDKLAESAAAHAKIVKADVEQAPTKARDYGVMSIPTLILFRDGQPVDKMQGAQSLGVLEDMIKRHLK